MTCTACPLHAGALTVCVRGRGSSEPVILLVGQNPGREEDLDGLAFIGKSGRLLDTMLADAGIDPTSTRFTNSVRCVTPDNRAPLPAESAACSRYLEDEIAETRPSVIVALGDVALKTLVGNRALSNVRGQELELHRRFDKHRCPVFATYHPAYVLRVPQARATVVTDLRRVRDRNIEHDKIEWKPWAPGAGLWGDVMAYDIETYDAHGQITERPTQIAIADGDSVYVTIRHLSLLVDCLRSAGSIVAHNGWAFDDLKTGVETAYDTRVIAHLLDETQPLNLESLCVKYLGVRGWKEDRAGAHLGTRELVVYNARDAAYTLRLFRVLWDQLTDRQKLIYAEIKRPARQALNSITTRGVYIDKAAVEEEQNQAEYSLEQTRQELTEELVRCGFGDERFNVQLKTKIKHVPFNPNSGDHVAAVLAFLGHRLPPTAKSGKLCTDAETLAQIHCRFARLMEAYREIAKRKSTYIDPYLEIASTGDGRAHPTYKIGTTATDRTACEKPNSQNLDRTLKRFKSARPGGVFTEGDYAGVEFRMGAFIAGERTIVQNYQDNALWDPHKFFATILYNKEAAAVTKDERQIAKSANFSQEYLGNEFTLYDYALRQMKVEIPIEQCRRIHRAWHRAFPDWRPWYQSVWDELVHNKGYVEGLTGQRRHIGDITLLNRQGHVDAWREVVNFKVQNFCTHIAQLSLRFCHEHGLPLVDHVHDSNAFEFGSMEQAEQAEPLIRHCMVAEPLRVLRDTFGIVPTVPLAVEIVHRPSQQLPGVQQVA